MLYFFCIRSVQKLSNSWFEFGNFLRLIPVSSSCFRNGKALIIKRIFAFQSSSFLHGNLHENIYEDYLSKRYDSSATSDFLEWAMEIQWFKLSIKSRSSVSLDFLLKWENICSNA